MSKCSFKNANHILINKYKNDLPLNDCCNLIKVYWTRNNQNGVSEITLFVARRTKRASTSQGFFKEDPDAGPLPWYARQLQKFRGPRRHFPKKGSLLCQAINKPSPSEEA